MNEFLNIKQEMIANVNNQIIGHKELAIQQVPVQLGISEQVEFTINVTLSSVNNQQILNKIASLILRVYQDGENGTRIPATNRQFCYSGRLNTCLELTSSSPSQITLKLFFLEKGTFKLSVLCNDEQTQDMLTSPIEAVLVIK